jgi:hypothetical protein
VPVSVTPVVRCSRVTKRQKLIAIEAGLRGDRTMLGQQVPAIRAMTNAQNQQLAVSLSE